MKRKTAILIAAALAATSAFAAPKNTNIPLPTTTVGVWYPCSNDYELHYTSTFGGKWDLYGTRQANPDGTITDTFNGTISGSARGTFTKANFSWMADTSFLVQHVWRPSSIFVVTITDGIGCTSCGHVEGSATYRP
jgi:hypothetical protein